MNTQDSSAVVPSAQRGGWLARLAPGEKRTLTATFGGYGVDAFDYYTLPLVTPLLLSLWSTTRTEMGLIATATLISSALGGWLAGILADRFGRVRILQLTIAVFAVFTFLCGLAQTPEQLMVTRTLQGLGFGGEWAVGSVLIAETIRPEFRGRALGLVQSSWAIGSAAAIVVFGLLEYWLPPEQAWRAMFLIGLAPALLILYIRRSVEDPPVYLQQRASAPQSGRAFLDIFKPAYLATTVLAALLFTGMQGGYYAINAWLPTFLREERNLTALASTGYQLTFAAGAFAGYLCSGHLSDRLGRRQTFILFAAASSVLVFVYMLIPIPATATLLIGFPLGFFISGIFSGSGAFLSELFPTAMRGSGQGFCYNFGRGIGSLLPAAVGMLSDGHTSLATAIGMCAVAAYGLVIVTALVLPERRAPNLQDV